MKLKVYGCRGSVPVSRSLRSRYGGNTSSMLLESGGEYLILDAGSGILRMEHDYKDINEDSHAKLPFKPSILLSHLHLDHIIGLAAYSPLFDHTTETKIYTISRDTRPLKSQIFGAFVPPYWPVSMTDDAFVECIEIFTNTPFNIGPFTITPFHAQHLDKTVSFHITDGEKSVVYLLDSELDLMTDKHYHELVNYCTDADLVVFDAAYTMEDYKTKRHWGHSTVEDGVRLAIKCNCERMLFSHFAPDYIDSELDELIAYLIPHGYGSRFIMASDGLSIKI